MNQSFGMAFMIKLLLIILFVVVSFAAVGLSIGKSFRVKNQIISLILGNNIYKLSLLYQK